MAYDSAIDAVNGLIEASKGVSEMKSNLLMYEAQFEREVPLERDNISLRHGFADLTVMTARSIHSTDAAVKAHAEAYLRQYLGLSPEITPETPNSEKLEHGLHETRIPVTLRLAPVLHARLQKLAQINGESLNDYLLRHLDDKP